MLTLNLYRKNRFLTLLLAVGLLFALSGCNQPTDTPPLPTALPTEIPPATETSAEPTAPPPKLVLVDPENQAGDEILSFLTSVANEEGLVLETSTSPELPPQGQESKVVVFLAQPANLVEIVSASPSTQFIVSGDVDVQAMPNLSVIRTAGEDLAFMGGFLTMQIAWDWRAGALIPSDIVKAAEKANAFENGARYVCGQCTPYYAPIVYFPLIGQEPAQAGEAGWDAQITNFAQHYVNSYFVDPAIATPQILERLKGLEEYINNDVNLIGSTLSSAESFTALLGFDILPALEQVMPQALSGAGGQIVNARVKIVVNNNDQVVTLAKTDNFNRVAADLAAGIIIPLSIP